MNTSSPSLFSFFSGRFFYRLVPQENDWPILEISGIRMHQLPVKKTVAKKVSLLMPLSGKRVLDIGTGLGYSAIALAQKGAEVTTLEIDENVLTVAANNPASTPLFEHPSIHIVLGDAADTVKKFPDMSFDRILHDPPHFSRAGHLYGSSFYKELFRLLTPGGILFHYTGTPYSRYRHRRFLSSIQERLQRAGFTHVTWVSQCLGYRAIRPYASPYKDMQ